MAPLHTAAGAVLAACLLQACGGTATRPEPATIAPLPLRLDDSAGLTAGHYYQLGRYLQQRGQDGEAAGAYQRSIALAPRQLDARNALAVLLAAQGHYDDAVALLRLVIADYPAQAQPRNNLGYIDHLRGDERAATDALREALRLDPGHAQARANLALVDAALTRTPATTAAAANTGPTVIDAATVADAHAVAAPAMMLPPPAAAPSRITAAASAASSPAPLRAAPMIVPLSAATMELVQVAPHELRLQARPAAAALAAAPSGKAAAAHSLLLAALADAAAAAQYSRDDVQADASIQIVNGNGVAGMGERVRRLLARRGALAGASVVDQHRHYQRRTIIEYLPGHEQQARVLYAALQGQALLLGARRLPQQTGIRIVLGHDLIGHIALIDASSGHPLAQQEPPAEASRAGRFATPNFNQE